MRCDGSRIIGVCLKLHDEPYESMSCLLAAWHHHGNAFLKVFKQQKKEPKRYKAANDDSRCLLY